MTRTSGPAKLPPKLGIAKLGFESGLIVGAAVLKLKNVFGLGIDPVPIVANGLINPFAINHGRAGSAA